MRACYAEATMHASVDRPAPRFLTATWRALAMLNYEVDPAVLAPWVPAGTELDAWNGRTFVSMVGFRFTDTRFYRVAVPFHVNFVRRAATDGLRRGVVFVREIVPRRAIAWLARAAYAERYVAMPMRHDVLLPSDGGSGRAAYAWRWRGAWQRLSMEVAGVPQLPAPGSQEEFITEHYWGYAAAPTAALSSIVSSTRSGGCGRRRRRRSSATWWPSTDRSGVLPSPARRDPRFWPTARRSWYAGARHCDGS